MPTVTQFLWVVVAVLLLAILVALAIRVAYAV
jgi:hypothetical protein